MADRRRLVTIAWDGTVTLVRDLEDGAKFFSVKDSFTVTPGQRKTIMASIARRYAGAIPAAETHDNGSIEWKMLVAGTSADDVIANVAALFGGFESTGRQFIEWRPEGATYSTYYELRGPATYKPTYSWAQFVGARSMYVDVTIPVAPLSRGDKQTISLVQNLVPNPGFEVDATGWITNNAGGTFNTAARSTAWAASGAASYLFDWTNAADATSRSPTLSTLIGTSGIPVAANTLYSVSFSANAITALAAAGLRYRLFWYQASGAASAVNAFSTGVTQPLQTTGLYSFSGSHTSPSDAAFGRVLIEFVNVTTPSDRGAVYFDNVRLWAGSLTAAAAIDGSLPTVVQLPAIPGDAPALVDLTVTSPGFATAPIWALLGWSRRPSAPLSGSVAPFGVIEAETATSLAGWAVSSDATYRGGSGLKVTASGAGTASAQFAVDPSVLQADDFTPEEIDVEVWARVALDTTLVLPQLTMSLLPAAGATFGGTQYTGEFGAAGKFLTGPSSGTGIFRRIRLGTLSLPYDTARPLAWNIRIAAAWSTGSTGTFGLDQLVLVPARQRACNVSNKANDAGYGQFIGSTAAASKTIRSDLSGRIASGAGNPARSAGLGGSTLEFQPGNVDLLLSLSNLVPDDPTSDATTEQQAWAGITGSLLVTPRYWLARSS